MFLAKSIKNSVFYSGLASSLWSTCLVYGEIQADRLWLPERYTKYYLDLKKAAEAAENLERCATVLRATIDLDRSTTEHPFYQILCRQPNGRSYNEIVDGLTFETSTIENIIPIEPTAEELEAMRLEEERQLAERREKRRLDLQATCDAELKAKVTLMNKVVWLNPNPPEPEAFDDDSALFIVDFDAQDGYGLPLKYRARCEFSQGDELKIRISGRRKLETKTQSEQEAKTDAE